MGILAKVGGFDIRRGGVIVGEMLDTFISGSGLPMPGLEGQVQSDVRAAIAGTGATTDLFWIHIFTKVPVSYMIRVAPVGDAPSANWWLND